MVKRFQHALGYPEFLIMNLFSFGRKNWIPGCRWSFAFLVKNKQTPNGSANMLLGIYYKTEVAKMMVVAIQ